MDNTSTINIKVCIVCGEALLGKKTKFCSKRCKWRFHGKTRAPSLNANSCRLKIRKNKKLEIINISGGSCQMCGYDKNYSVLSFHHFDSKSMLFRLNCRAIEGHTPKEILAEVAKCQLLCMNCHGEIHHPDLNNFSELDKDYLSNLRYGMNRAITRKINIINDLGIRCELCGYNKNLSSLCFHHRDPSQKLFNLDASNMANRSLKSLLFEASKCQLLCMNCHSELHNPSSIIQPI
jgi:hypothetical protein